MKYFDQETETIKIADRCDRCGARAYALARVSGTILLFCGHHFAKHLPRLREFADLIADERHRLLKRATSDVPGQEARKPVGAR